VRAWSQPSVDLTGYAGKSVQVAFDWFSGDHYYNSGPGWFVDNVTLVTGPITTLTPMCRWILKVVWETGQ